MVEKVTARGAVAVEARVSTRAAAPGPPTLDGQDCLGDMDPPRRRKQAPPGVAQHDIFINCVRSARSDRVRHLFQDFIRQGLLLTKNFITWWEWQPTIFRRFFRCCC